MNANEDGSLPTKVDTIASFVVQGEANSTKKQRVESFGEQKKGFRGLNDATLNLIHLSKSDCKESEKHTQEIIKRR